MCIRDSLNTICAKFVSDKKDLIVAIATPTAHAAAAATAVSYTHLLRQSILSL